MNIADLLALDRDDQSAVILSKIDAWRKERRRNAARDWTPPAGAPDEPARFQDYRLQFGTPKEAAAAGVIVPARDGTAAMDLHELRRYLPQRMAALLDMRQRAQTINLIMIPAGGGKTHAAVHAVQTLAAQGKRVLWAAQRHDVWGDLLAIPGFDPRLWYQWLSMNAEIDENVTACRLYDDGMGQWLHKGYPAGQLCWQVCSADGHMKNECPYRTQAPRARARAVVFAMHNHLTTGLDAGSFDACVIDECPLGAFVQERLIPVSGVNVGGVSPAVSDLTRRIKWHCEKLEESQTLKGRPLFDAIGRELENVYIVDEVLSQSMPDIPRLYSLADIDSAPYWYVADMLRLADAEYNAWLAGWERWESRIWLSTAGLHMLERSDAWADLPHNIMILDATGTSELYESLFPAATVERQRPRIKRAGRFHQVTCRLNGHTQLQSARSAKDILNATKAIVAWHGYERPGVICHKKTRPIFEAEYGESSVLHFGALRGTNVLRDVDALFVCGTPSPPPESILRLAVALSDDISPLARFEDERGFPVLYHHQALKAYQLRDADRLAWRPVGGYWQHPTLHAVHAQHRAAEMVQAIFRARPLDNQADVFIFSSIPLDLIELDSIQDTPRPLCGGLDQPGWVSWRDWVAIAPYLAAMYEAGQAFGYRDLADWLVRDLPADKRHEAHKKALARMQRGQWLEKIVNALGGTIETMARPGGRGRPGKAVFTGGNY